MGRMKGSCSECVLRIPGTRRWDNQNGPGCAAVLDGIHPIGWGRQEENEEPERNVQGIILCKPCFYFVAVDATRETGDLVR